MGYVRPGSIAVIPLVALVVAGACSTYTADPGPPEGGKDTGANSSGGTSDGGSKGGSGGHLGPGPIDLGGEPAVGGCDPGTSATCGLDPSQLGFCSDGRQDPGEACDDGNAVSGDGCTATCAQVEGDYVCPTPGEACVSTVKCGDKKVGSGETCDDGQATPKSGDGCSDTCQLEKGWVCPVAGEACQAAQCGDKLIAGNEQCDDGNAMPDDGCSDTCQLEDGYVCPTVGEDCKPTVCGDGKREGNEPCDDGNQIIGDGCTTLCQVEPNCAKTGGACTSRCGDGLLLPADDEECDDGNVVDGDGCSAKCTIEVGYACAPAAGALPATIQLPFVFRDFVSFPASGKTVPRHPDFNAGCRGLWKEGLVNDVLDAEGKPTNTHLCDLPAAPACTVKTGYVDVKADFCYQLDDCGGTPPDSKVTCAGLTHGNHPLAGHPNDDPFKFWYRDTADVNKTQVQSLLLFRNNTGLYSFSSNAFFPINDFGWVKSGEESKFVFNNESRNYGFTTEVRYWFQFKGGETLTFSGDDDVWVFVNGRLALDMGGKHQTGSRTMVLNVNGSATCATCDTTTRQLGITVGNVYEIALFHAERQSAGSNFSLSLSGFFAQKSECKTVCGDGIVTGTEECDLGKANGSGNYGGCTAQCKRGAYCGDGHVDKPDEDCDDSVNASQYGGCAPGCKSGPYCGDGVVQSQFEECDDGKLDGAYGGCDEGCVLGPRCGDKVVQKDAGEECDDGNHKNLDGCTANCRVEIPK